MQLRDFQTIGSSFLQDKAYRLLCDDAGLGKSAMVLDAADNLGLKRVLCVGPAVAGVSWPLQISQWSPSRTFVNLDLGENFGFDLPGFYFVSYDMLSQKKGRAIVAALASCKKWDALVLDEGQYLKSAGANRTKAIYGAKGEGTTSPEGLARNAARIWVLSGTLTPNHAGEAYTHLRALFPDVLVSIPAFGGRVPEQHEFEDMFCDVRDTVYGRAITGSKNQKVLRAAIAPVLLRRRKINVMPELPPMEWLTAPLDLDASVVREIYAAGLLAAGLPYDSAAEDLDDDQLAAFLAANETNLAAQRRSLGLAKVPACVRWVKERLTAGEPKVIVFAHHRAVIEGLMAGLLNHSPVQLHGGTGTTERAQAVEQFQKAPSCRVFIGQIVAAGTAITLTAAKTVFFAEYAGTPGVNYQAASRAHRMGQRDGVQVYFGSVPNSLDEKIARTAARRAREISELFD